MKNDVVSIICTLFTKLGQNMINMVLLIMQEWKDQETRKDIYKLMQPNTFDKG